MIYLKLSLIAGVVLVFFWYTHGKLLPQWRVFRWRKYWNIHEHQHNFNTIYANVDGFLSSRQARTVAADAIEYTYGEITFESFIALLGVCKPNLATVFYDLGSGAGKAVIAAAMVYDCQRYYGIELFPNLIRLANQQKQKLNQLETYTEKSEKIVFVEGDFMKHHLTDATILLVNSSCYFGAYWQDCTDFLAALNPGTLIISLSKPVIHPHISAIKRCEVLMSWGITEAFIQKTI